MEIHDFNRPAAAPPAQAAMADAGDSAETTADAPALRQATEITLLKKRIEHLELVVETARSLMTSNQERLLRRLHDLPQEMLALTATLNRLDQAGGPRDGELEPRISEPVRARRVA
jgi:hypothetical protein